MDFRTIPHIAEGLRGLEETRRRAWDAWMDRLGVDAVAFPALADVGPADADVNPAAADLAWRNGVWVANGNLAIRHLGIPTVTVPMGIMADTGMPMGLTLAGRSGKDAALLALAVAVERLAPARRAPPPRTPELTLPPVPAVRLGPEPGPAIRVTTCSEGDLLHLTVVAEAPLIHLSVAGRPVPHDRFRAVLTLPRNTHRHSEWAPPRGPLVVALFVEGGAAFVEADG